jgi:HSP20 family molecular chaperone IbpA
MDPTTVELMLDQVRAIHRALTGNDPPEPPSETLSAKAPLAEEVVHRFANLEAIARHMPNIIERVPPFSFSPPLDALNDEHEVLIEIAVPGVERKDVKVERTGQLVVISGFRRGERVANGRTYFHAEIPRGPFHRVVRLPFALLGELGEPRIEFNQGLIEIHFPKTSVGTSPARA